MIYAKMPYTMEKLSFGKEFTELPLFSISKGKACV